MIRKEDFVHRNVSHCIKKLSLGFPGGLVVKNPSASAGYRDLFPGPGRSHIPRDNLAQAPQLSSL